jgi:hypothetical protein
MLFQKVFLKKYSTFVKEISRKLRKGFNKEKQMLSLHDND